MTGATSSMRSLGGYSSFGVGKFGLRALAQSVADEFGPKGIHVSHVIIDGGVAGPIIEKFQQKNSINIPEGSLMKTSAIADQYWNLINQDKSTWTFEIDLRPHTDKIYYMNSML